MNPRRVLVVEDDDSIRRLLMECLAEGTHVRIDGARDGAEALHRITTADYSVVILDLVMPHMSGIDFLSSIQSMMTDASIRARDTEVPTIILTSLSEEDLPNVTIRKRFPRLVKAIHRKPVDVPVLVENVKEFL